jgi:hypothetical protein
MSEVYRAAVYTKLAVLHQLPGRFAVQKGHEFVLGLVSLGRLIPRTKIRVLN